ncbi:hypothetical protein U91I_02672 [alpha proteobacterium U9-1i]|nr:hypothetical protein U91I_02672 [alpha proteobacterium U9-1i]
MAGALGEVSPPFGAPFAAVRMHSMLAEGADQLCARAALARDWELVAPLPFGRMLNIAINALPTSADDARALLAGAAPADPATATRAQAIHELQERAHLFELADADDPIALAYLAMHDAPDDANAANIYDADASQRAALAARIVIEQSDILIAIWDGARTTFVGGTGHTVAAALALGGNVVWIDPAAPEDWRILGAPEALAALHAAPSRTDRDGQLKRLVAQAVSPREPQAKGHAPNSYGVHSLDGLHWRTCSNPVWHAYRRVEALFSGEKASNPWRDLQQIYERPDAIEQGSGARVLDALANMPGADATLPERTAPMVLARFAWADGISSYLSDLYRSGMSVNFGLSALAIICGIAYLPLVGSAWKWPFALFEFVLLATIVGITWQGQKRRWHGRWFETRRVAEYLRHAPILLALGAARAPGNWPEGAETSWPEHYARHALREVGLPKTVVTASYLRAALTNILDVHVSTQRDYHRAKAKRLSNVHHKLDKLSEKLFQVAVASVAIYLVMAAAAGAHLIEKDAFKTLSNIFTFLGVALPTLGGAIAGIRYFGDFERFAAISEITAGKLDAVHDRIALLATSDALNYGAVAELAHAADEIVVSEIENWQAVFGGKHITVPV